MRVGVAVGVLSLIVGCRALNDNPVAEIPEAGISNPKEAEGGNPPLPTPDADAATSDDPDASVVVYSSPPGTVETIAGSEMRGSTDGTGATAQFDNPVGVFIEPAGSVLVTEYEGGRIRRIDTAGSTSTIATIAEPFAIVATTDAIFVQSDRDENGAKGDRTGTIFRVGLSGGVPEIVIGKQGRPRGLAVLSDGRIFVSDRTRNVVSILNPADQSLALLAGSGAPGFVDGNGAQAAFNNPYGAALLPDGSVVVADFGNHCIRRITMNGDVVLFAGDGTRGMRDDTDKYKARFDKPQDVATDAIGNVFVSDVGNHRIRRISPSGVVETIAGDGTQGFADGDGKTVRFYGQEQLDVTADGKTLYVTDGSYGEDVNYHRVRRIVLP